jgi:prophage regulatory protein
MNDSPKLERFLPISAVQHAVGLRKTAIYRKIGEGTFPRSRRYIGSSRVFWLESEIIAWQQSQLECARRDEESHLLRDFA